MRIGTRRLYVGIVKLALNRPYTFIVLALLIFVSQPARNSAYSNRHFPEYRHPGYLGRLDLHGIESGRS